MPKGKYDFHLKKKPTLNNYCTALPVNKNDNSQRYESLKVGNNVQVLYQKGKCCPALEVVIQGPVFAVQFGMCHQPCAAD